MQSFKAEVKTKNVDGTQTWVANAQRFTTREEASAAADWVGSRWSTILDTRVVYSEDAPNYRWDFDTGRIVKLAPEPEGNRPMGAHD